MPLVIDIVSTVRRPWVALSLLRRVARHVAAAEGFREGRLSVAVVGGRSMATLHARVLHDATPTDVLSFDLGTRRRRGLLDGEVVVCADVALARARARRARSVERAARAELALYLTHGLLHLAGYDDHAAADFRRMHRREDELLEELGLGRVFSGGGGSARSGLRNR